MSHSFRKKIEDKKNFEIKKSIPVWMYLNVIALDAPFIAVLWQYFLMKTFKLEVSISETMALFFVVWFIYLIDRFFDSFIDFHKTERHFFTKQHPKLIILLILFTFLTSLLLIINLDPSIIRGGLVLGCFIILYFLLVHAGAKNLIVQTISKEMLVGIGFGTGVGLPVIVSDLPIQTWLPTIALFCLICWLNCRLIDKWESKNQTLSRKDIAFVILIFAFMFSCELKMAITILISLACFGFIEKFYGGKNPKLSRVLADISLLSPCIFLELK